jgi:hypothetical protein
MSMEKEGKTTNTQEEISKGRIALWLSVDDIKFIANEWRKIPEDAPIQVRETWGRLAFRAMTALHKSNIEYEPIFPENSDKYSLRIEIKE